MAREMWLIRDGKNNGKVCVRLRSVAEKLHARMWEKYRKARREEEYGVENAAVPDAGALKGVKIDGEQGSEK